MADVHAVTSSVVAAHGRPDVLDAIVLDGAIVHRVASDELVAIGPPEGGAALVDALTAAVEDDGGAVVLDVSDGWRGVAIRGDDARRAFSRLSPLRLPDRGTVQGDVLRLPARVVVSPEELVVLVPSSYAAWLERKIRERCPEVRAEEAGP